ncbi:acyclic terpene utilization AtuA family protein [uncultured Microbulbifer sp.]|uniref:acyclic terpene utilization AtuA family protein n=1 Tax=uncultured Microbulbifer sp. TaxID=348147 RepID=UPI002606DA67|nr:acyclic terpene utilization AtuA family protein [uncultured Microbulbifer sp.]
MDKQSVIRIANAQGFWGDSALGPRQILAEEQIDYITFDYLAEVSMSILQKQRMQNPDMGYAQDFVNMIKKVMPVCKERGIKIVANAAGVNATACLNNTKNALKELGLFGTKIAIVEGDDILGQLDQLIKNGQELKNMESGKALKSVLQKVTSANVYIGARPIVEALNKGADIVITGRVSDPSLTLAPLVYEFKWSMDDYDRLAAGTIMGHLLECGTQATGGNYTDWKKVSGFANMGFPIVEAQAGGSFVLTKVKNTGGLVTIATATSQLLYEISDPENYLGPDCIADFTSIQLTQEGENRVAFSNIKGKPPTSNYKVSISYEKGYKILSTLCVSGPDAIEKANLMYNMVFARLSMHGIDIPEQDRFLEIFGTNVLYKGLVPTNPQPHEVLVRIGAKGPDAKSLNVLGSEIAPLITSGPPGITGFAGGRARAKAIVGYWPALIEKTKVNTTVWVEEI